ncbi:hypothetical protein AGABI2DRAFT_192798, partial [Agaricus bisporus var. bisporus H97]|uniref:hypothetical protein n=1 Tax=Agaricus bisporus var. bisporus (strain H97 / ATCC MYA-4626 / FGSC 10389) TaxID=936046 RepID=UPI00029F5F91
PPSSIPTTWYHLSYSSAFSLPLLICLLNGLFVNSRKTLGQPLTLTNFDLVETNPGSTPSLRIDQPRKSSITKLYENKPYRSLIKRSWGNSPWNNFGA